MRAKRNRRGIINKSANFFLLIMLIFSLSSFVITAQDENILTIETPDWIVEPDQEFVVTVTYQRNGTSTPVKGAKVSIEGEMSTYTGESGKAWLTAPSTEGKYSIVAEIDEDMVRDEIKVDAGPAFWETTTFPIILGGICLIGAIFFVYFREKRSIYNRAAQISKENILQNYGNNQERNKPIKKPADTKNADTFNQNKNESHQTPYHQKPIRSTNNNDSKVEEIRIRRPRKERKVVSVENEEDKTEKVIRDAKMKKSGEDWFQGNEEAKYEVGKITGEVDEEKIDKWFEGYDNLKEKIDEKVKKDKKKRKKEDDDE